MSKRHTVRATSPYLERVLSVMDVTNGATLAGMAVQALTEALTEADSLASAVTGLAKAERLFDMLGQLCRTWSAVARERTPR